MDYWGLEFFEQNLNPRYYNTFRNDAFSPNGKKYFQENLTVFHEEGICKCQCN